MLLAKETQCKWKSTYIPRVSRTHVKKIIFVVLAVRWRWRWVEQPLSQFSSLLREPPDGLNFEIIQWSRWSQIHHLMNGFKIIFNLVRTSIENGNCSSVCPRFHWPKRKQSFKFLHAKDKQRSRIYKNWSKVFGVEYLESIDGFWRKSFLRKMAVSTKTFFSLLFTKKLKKQFSGRKKQFLVKHFISRRISYVRIRVFPEWIRPYVRPS
jgi:hypothetical protein